MNKKIITISRECGSGGHSIAEKLSKELDIPCYDKEIITLVAKKCDVSNEYAEKAGELLSGGIINHYLGYHDNVIPYAYPTIEDQINSTQVEIIKELANKGPCIIVGRGADYILNDRSDVLNVFIKAKMSYKIKISKAKHNLKEKEAKSILIKRDKERSKHYYFYTGQTWGDIKNYDIILDSGELGEDMCVNILKNIFNK